MSSSPEPNPIAGVILAAGASTRMGQSKQLLEYEGAPMVHRTAQSALTAGLSPVIVVTGADRAGVEAALGNLDVEPVFNPNYAEGQSTSLGVGVRALAGDVPAALMLLTDQPLLTTDDLRIIVNAYSKTRPAIVVPIYGKMRGSPVLFRRDLFPELLRVSGDHGGRSVIDKHLDEAIFVEMLNPLAGQDVDTPEAYDQLLARGDEGHSN